MGQGSHVHLFTAESVGKPAEMETTPGTRSLAFVFPTQGLGMVPTVVL